MFERLRDCTFLKFVVNKNRIQITDTLNYDHIIFEFDNHAPSTITADYIIIQFSTKQNAISFENKIVGDCHVKIELNADKMNMWVNNVPKETNYQLQQNINTGMNLRFGLNNGSDGIKVSNVLVYKL